MVEGPKKEKNTKAFTLISTVLNCTEADIMRADCGSSVPCKEQGCEYA